jgi:hypothetical protein
MSRTPCGTEAIVHTLRRAIAAKTTGTLLKLDFANAFNIVMRSKVLEVVREQVPSLYLTIFQAYDNYLLFGEELIQSSESLQQGELLALPLLCFVIHALVVQSLQSPMNSWYLDEGTLDGPGYKVLNINPKGHSGHWATSECWKMRAVRDRRLGPGRN